MNSNHETINFYYDDCCMAISATAMLRRYINKNGLPFIAIRRKNNVFIIKQQNKGGKI
jgi:hypothetical protein